MSRGFSDPGKPIDSVSAALRVLVNLVRRRPDERKEQDANPNENPVIRFHAAIIPS